MSECPHEHEVMAALRGQKLTAQLQQHSACCSECGSAIALSKLMQTDIDEQFRASQAIPHPQVVWLKAKYAQRKRHAQVRRRFIVVGTLAVVVVAALLSYLINPQPVALDSFSRSEILKTFASLSTPFPTILLSLLLVLLLGSSSSRHNSFNRF